MILKNLHTVLKEDYGILSKFLANFEDEERDEEFWLRRMNHWWDENPACKDKNIRGLYITDEEKNIIGFIGLIPTFFQFNLNTEIIYSATTWRVEKKHRKRSFLMFSQIVNEANKTFLFDTTPSTSVERILKAFKFNAFPKLNNATYMYFPDLKESVIKRFPFIKSISFFLAPFFWILAFLQELTLKKSNSLQNTVQILEAGKEFDDLWEETKNDCRNTNVRNADVINWLCFSGGVSKKYLFGQYEKGKLISYVIFSEIKNQYSKQLILCDIWGSQTSEIVLRDLFSVAIKFGKTNNFDLIIFNSFNDEQNTVLQRMRLLKRPFTQRRYYKSINELKAEYSYLTLLQGDYSL